MLTRVIFAISANDMSAYSLKTITSLCGKSNTSMASLRIAANSFYITESHGFSGTSPSRLSVDGNPLIGPAPQDLLAPAPGMGAQAGAPHQHKYPNDPQDLSEGSLNRPDRLLYIPRLCSGSFLPKILEPR